MIMKIIKIQKIITVIIAIMITLKTFVMIIVMKVMVTVMLYLFKLLLFRIFFFLFKIIYDWKTYFTNYKLQTNKKEKRKNFYHPFYPSLWLLKTNFFCLLYSLGLLLPSPHSLRG